MQSKATTVDQYIAELPADRKEAMEMLRSAITKKLPKGFKEEMSYGMIGYVVPHTLYPAGYHCNPKLPLPLINIASQKNFIVLHHIGLYGSKKLLDWFTTEYEKQAPGEMDMGKGCVRFKKPEQIPFKLIGELAAKLSVADWIKTYEDVFKRPKKK